MGWWRRRRWRDGRTDRVKMQEGRQSVWGGWWSSMTWSHDPERNKTNKNGKHGLDRRTLLNYRGETQQNGGEKRTETIKTTKTA